MTAEEAHFARGFAEPMQYSVSQVVGWSLYGVLQYLLSSGPPSLRAAGAAAVCAAGLAGTHLLHVYASRRRRSLSGLVVPFAIAALVIPAAMNAARTAVLSFLGDRPAPEHPWIAVAHYVQAVLIIAIWCAVYLSAGEIRRRRSAEMEALRLALVAQEAQFRALRSQLNPHFLFNCLNSLRELVDADRERAKLVIDRLAELLRYTLRADRLQTVSLREELQAVEDYLALEHVRFEERLRVSYDVDPDSLDAKLPPMLMQTLVENGIKHGIARLPAGGELSIVSHVAEGRLRVDVTNSGRLPESTQTDDAVGLENARARLRLMYGDGASLTLGALAEDLVRATVMIPLEVGA